MAIYSLRLTPIGKTTQKRPHTAAAHIRYISRSCALSHSMAERMPERPAAAMRWLRKEEDHDRKNARVADKLVIALPRELTAQQRITLVWQFAERLTQGKASWYAAIHAKGKDRDNPHCHLLVRDRDVTAGRRVVMFSAGKKEIKQRAGKGQPMPTTLAQIRALWEKYANQALADAGRAERIDHRSLKAQGQERSPQIHEGPNIRAMHQRGYRPRSKDRQVRSRAIRRCGTPATRLVRYTDIDQGLTRVDYNLSLRTTSDTSRVLSDPMVWLDRLNGGREPIADRMALPADAGAARVDLMADTNDDRHAALTAEFAGVKADLAKALGDAFVDADRAADSLLSMAEEFGPEFVLEALDRDPADIDERQEAERVTFEKPKIETALLRLLDLQDDLDNAARSLSPLDGNRQRLDIQGERFILAPDEDLYYRENNPDDRFPLEAGSREPLSLTEQLARDHGIEPAQPHPQQERTRER